MAKSKPKTKPVPDPPPSRLRGKGLLPYGGRPGPTEPWKPDTRPKYGPPQPRPEGRLRGKGLIQDKTSSKKPKKPAIQPNGVWTILGTK